MADQVQELTDATFDATIRSAALPVIVDFWAPWCNPCMAFKPTFEAYAKKLAGKAILVSMNVDENYMIPTKYGIRSIPQIHVFKGGKQINVAVGAKKAELILKSYLSR